MTADAVRQAVASGDYTAAAALFDAYARSRPPLAELRELARWTRITVLCAKAHEEDRIRRMQAEIQVLAAYGR
jgi:hypothetical protein